MNLVVLIIILCLISTSHGHDIPIHQSEYSLQVGNRESGIRVELFVDLACPDSKDAWTVLLETANYYKDNAVFLIHLFPLPFHTYSFLATKAIVYTWNMYGTEYALEAMNILFAKQDKLEISEENKVKSYNSIADVIAKLVSGKVPDMSVDDMLEGLNDDAVEELARSMWKYGAEKSIHNAPVFFINGIEVDSLNSESSTSDWKDILDPLVAESTSVMSSKGASKALPKTLTDTVLSDALRVDVEEESSIPPVFKDHMMYESNLVMGFCGFLFLFGVFYIAMVVVKYTHLRPRSDREGPVLLPTQPAALGTDNESPDSPPAPAHNYDYEVIAGMNYGTDDSTSGLM